MWSFNFPPESTAPYIYEIMVHRTTQASRTKNIQKTQGLGYFGQMILLEIFVHIITCFNVFLIETAHCAMELTEILGLGEHLAEVMRHVGCNMYR
jgi:hypothetical protein